MLIALCDFNLKGSSGAPASAHEVYQIELIACAAEKNHLSTIPSISML